MGVHPGAPIRDGRVPSFPPPFPAVDEQSGGETRRGGRCAGRTGLLIQGRVEVEDKLWLGCFPRSAGAVEGVEGGHASLSRSPIHCTTTT